MQNRTPSPRPIPDFDPVPRRHARSDGWTGERQRAFIAALAETGSVRAAARRINMASEGAYALRRAPGAQSFAAAWDAAIDHGVQSLADIAVERAKEGVAVPVYYRGEQVGEKRAYNDRLLMFLLKHRLPEHGGQAPAMPPPPGRHLLSSTAPAALAPPAPDAPQGVPLLEGGMGRDNGDRGLPPQRPAPIGRRTGPRCRDCERREKIEAFETFNREHPDEYHRMRVALLERYFAKVKCERAERLAGRVIAADFTLRQLTHIELIMDIGGMMRTVVERYTGMGATGWQGQKPFASEFSEGMARIRDAAWEQAGEPPRPFVHRPRNLIDDVPRPGPTRAEREQAGREAQAVIARAQRKWEAAATEAGWAAWLAAEGG